MAPGFGSSPKRTAAWPPFFCQQIIRCGNEWKPGVDILTFSAGQKSTSPVCPSACCRRTILGHRVECVIHSKCAIYSALKTLVKRHFSPESLASFPESLIKGRAFPKVPVKEHPFPKV